MAEKVSSISQRIKEGLEMRDMSQSDLCKLTKIGKSSISTYISGDYEPKQTNLFKIANALNVDIEWLSGYDVSVTGQKNKKSTNFSYKYFDLGVSAGFLESLTVKTEPDDYIELSDRIMGKYSGRKSIILLRVNGDSMNRIIPHGSYIVVDTAKKRISDISDRDIIVFSDNNEYSVKRYINDKINQRFLFKPDSTNDIFTPIEIKYENATNLKLIGKVVKYIVDLD